MKLLTHRCTIACDLFNPSAVYISVVLIHRLTPSGVSPEVCPWMHGLSSKVFLRILSRLPDYFIDFILAQIVSSELWIEIKFVIPDSAPESDQRTHYTFTNLRCWIEFSMTWKVWYDLWVVSNYYLILFAKVNETVGRLYKADTDISHRLTGYLWYVSFFKILNAR